MTSRYDSTLEIASPRIPSAPRFIRVKPRFQPISNVNAKSFYPSFYPLSFYARPICTRKYGEVITIITC